MTKEQLFHNNRIMFVILNGQVKYGPVGFSHKNWLVGQNILTEAAYEQVVRGYYDETGVYFYQGNFETNNLVEATACEVSDQFDKQLPIYCGCIIGEIGERWNPIKRLR